MKPLKLPTRLSATVERLVAEPRRATKFTREKMADRNFEASLPAVVRVVMFNSGDSSPSSTILAISVGYAVQVTDLVKIPMILIRSGILTGSAPSGVVLKCVSFLSALKFETLTSRNKVEAKPLQASNLRDLWPR